MSALDTSLGEDLVRDVRAKTRRWLVTGSAGFIGSHLVENLLLLDQDVVSLDNFATGHQHNLDQIAANVGADRWRRHRFIEGDIRDPKTCRSVCEGVEIVLHNAALGSVPRSIEDPAATNAANIDGFLNMLVATRDAGAKRFLYAASSSTYGDSPALPKVEHVIGAPLSPYAVTKYVNELYADVFARCYGMECVGLRYFNVFGPRQDPNGAYAAVIPRWAHALLSGQTVYINGDGETSRDFCYVANVVQANLRAAITERADAVNQIYNVAVGGRTTLNQLFDAIRDLLAVARPDLRGAKPVYRDFRKGDVRHSQADIGKAAERLGYAPVFTAQEGLAVAMPWYLRQSLARGSASAANAPVA